MASAGKDQAVHVWKSEDGKKVRTIGNSGATINALAVRGDHLFTGGSDGVVREHTVDGKTVRKFMGHNAAIFSLAIHSASGTLASGSYDGTVNYWRIEDGALVQSFVAAPGLATTR